MPILLGMTCENCGAPARLDPNRGVFVCDYCGSEFVPPASEDGVQVLGQTELHCPACDRILSNGQLELYPLLYCTACRGMLIAMEQFETIIETLRAHDAHPGAVIAPRYAPDGQPPRHCPHCSQPMDNHPYGGPGNVVIDTCENCSVNWLDKGELQRIVSAPDYTYQEPRLSIRDSEAPLS